MSESLEIRAVLVDMDGTVVDSHASVELYWSVVAQRYGLDVDEILAYCHGRPAADTMGRFAPHVAEEEWHGLHEELEAKAGDRRRLIKPIPGAARFLGQLVESGVPWALVTSAPTHAARKHFVTCEFPWPEAVVSVEEITKGKPDPEGYLMAADMLEVSADQTVVFEDAPAGIRAGVASGAKVIVVGSHPLDSLRLEEGGDMAESIVAQVPTLEAVSVERTETPEVFRLKW